jgi:serine/threonine-protein kinase
VSSATSGPQRLGQYRLVEQLAVGGMAEIYVATTAGVAGFEKRVALKVIHPNYSEDPDFVQMLIDEAKLAVQLQHANIVQTYDLGRVDEQYYIAMELIDGVDLYRLLRRASELDIDFPFEVVAFVGQEVSAGLDYAHKKTDQKGRPLEIVHRDVSPQNVLLSRGGEVKIVDFGIAKAAQRNQRTAAGVIKGKYYYMSPEQAWGDKVDARSDVFSTGILMYEMLVGQMLYLEDDLDLLLEKVRRANIPPPSTKRKGIPPELEAIVMKALKKRVDERWQSSGELGAALTKWLRTHARDMNAGKLAAFVMRVLGPAAKAQPKPAALPDDAPDFGDEALADENSLIFRMSDVKRSPSPTKPSKQTTPAKAPAAAPPRKRDQATSPVSLPEAMEAVANDYEESDATIVDAGGEMLLGRMPTGAIPATSDPLDDEDAPTLGFDESDDDGEPGEDRTIVGHNTPKPRKPNGSSKPSAPSTSAPPPSSSPAAPPSSSARGPTVSLRAPAVTPSADDSDFEDSLDGLELLGNPSFDDEEEDEATRQRLKSTLELRRKIKKRPPAAGADTGASTAPRSPLEGTTQETLPFADARSESGSGPTETKPSPAPVSPAPAAPTSPIAFPPTVPSPSASPPPSAAVTTMLPPAANPLSTGAPLPTGGSSFPSSSEEPTRLPPNRPLPPPSQQLPTFPFEGFGDTGASNAVGGTVTGTGPTNPTGPTGDVRPSRRGLLLRGIGAALALTAVAVALVLTRTPAPRATIEVVSLPPGAEVRIDGKLLPGVTPLEILDVDAQRPHQVRVELRGHDPWSEEVRFSPNQTQMRVQAVLTSQLGTLELDTIPSGAEAIVNGRVRGTTPVVVSDLPPSEDVVIEVRLRGHKSERRRLQMPPPQSTKAGRRLEVRIPLERTDSGGIR